MDNESTELTANGVTVHIHPQASEDPDDDYEPRIVIVTRRRYAVSVNGRQVMTINDAQPQALRPAAMDQLQLAQLVPGLRGMAQAAEPATQAGANRIRVTGYLDPADVEPFDVDTAGELTQEGLVGVLQRRLQDLQDVVAQVENAGRGRHG